MGRDRRGHRHGRRDAGLPAGPLGPAGAVRRKGPLDTARDTGNHPRGDARTGRAAGTVRPQTYYDALARAGRSTDEITDISGRFPKRFVPFIGSGTGGSSALYGMVCERFFVQDFTPRQNFADPGRIHRARSLADHLRPTQPLVCPSRETARRARPTRPAAPGSRRRGFAGRATVFPRQPTPGQLSGRARLAPLPPADGLRLHRRVHHLPGLPVPQAVQERRRPQRRAARHHRARRPPAHRMPGACAWRPTAPGSNR